jgi:hypothetical protein
MDKSAKYQLQNCGKRATLLKRRSRPMTRLRVWIVVMLLAMLARVVHGGINTSKEFPFRWVVIRSTSEPIVVILPEDAWKQARGLRYLALGNNDDLWRTPFFTIAAN